MIIPSPSKLMTSEEFMALPDVEGVTRRLIRGKHREVFKNPASKRNPDHGSAMANICAILQTWIRKQPKPRGRVYCGETYFRLRKDPDITVGIDVAYVSPKLAALTRRGPGFVDGAPSLAVEILAPNDKFEDIHNGIDLYFEHGVKLIWIICPFNRTVTVYRRHYVPFMYTVGREIAESASLPGLKVKVSNIFDY
jgi:Uma2 family endonuclease